VARGSTRRRFLAQVGAAAGALASGASSLDLLAACDGRAADSSGAGPERRLEIFSWWTAKGEREALRVLIDLYEQRYGVKVTNSAVEGGAGTNAQPVLSARMQSGRPPDTFQVHPGQELIGTWARTGKMEPINTIWEQQHWDKAIPAALKKLVSSGPDIWAVPLNIHRVNAIWWTAASRRGASPVRSFEDLMKELKGATDRGMPAPLALGSRGNWQVALLFETCALARWGPAFFRQLFQGTVSFLDDRVKDTLSQVLTLLTYANSNHRVLDWNEATDLVVDGSAMFTIMGDWVKGYFTTLGCKPNRDFFGAASPGTAGSYLMALDAFGLPRGASHLANAVAWLEVCGSKEGQTLFNPRKGSIPARNDVPVSLLDPISRAFMSDFRNARATLLSSADGSATPQDFVMRFNDEMGQFIEQQDVRSTAERLQALASRYLSHVGDQQTRS